MKFSVLDIVVILVFVVNVVVGLLLNNIPSAIGWGVATMWFIRYLQVSDALLGAAE